MTEPTFKSRLTKKYCTGELYAGLLISLHSTLSYIHLDDVIFYWLNPGIGALLRQRWKVHALLSWTTTPWSYLLIWSGEDNKSICGVWPGQLLAFFKHGLCELVFVVCFFFLILPVYFAPKLKSSHFVCIFHLLTFIFIFSTSIEIIYFRTNLIQGSHYYHHFPDGLRERTCQSQVRISSSQKGIRTSAWVLPPKGGPIKQVWVNATFSLAASWYSSLPCQKYIQKPLW